jgi:hypothetical protein
MQISSSISIWSTNYIPVVSASGVTYLLDTYSATAAYSLRQLKTGVTNVVRVRRSSDSAESDFTATEITDGTLTTWTGANDGFVVTWYDQSGNSNDISQSTAADQPSIVSSGVVNLKNGKPSTIYDGTSDYLTRANLTALNAYPFSVFGVGNNVDSAELAPIVSQRNSTGDFSGCSMFFDRTVNTIGFSIDQGASNAVFNYPSQLDNADQRIQSFCITSGGDGELWLNGTSQETISGVSSYATSVTANLNIGKQDLGSLDSLMHIQEVIIYNSDQTSNQSAIENNINENYDLYWNGQNTGILDTYSAAAAYSLRALRSGHTSDIIKIRRSSDNAERGFRATWSGEFPTAAVQNWVGAGNDGFVVTWYDQAGSKDMTESTAANQPQIVSSGSVITDGANPALYFDGTNDQFTATGVSNWDLANNLTLVGVASQPDAATASVIFSQRTGSGSPTKGWWVAVDTSTAKNFLAFNDGSLDVLNLTSQETTTDQRLYFFTSATGTLNGYYNGTQQETGVTASTTYTATPNFSIGRLGQQSIWYKSYQQEIIIFESDESSNRTAIESDINDHYSIY